MRVSREPPFSMDFTSLAYNCDRRPPHVFPEFDVDGDISFRDAEGVFMQEDGFPVIELAQELERWYGTGSPAGDFIFVTENGADPGILSLTWDGFSWAVASIWQDRPSVARLSPHELEALVSGFVESVAQRAKDELGLDPAAWRVS